jgi:hypothetical protein
MSYDTLRTLLDTLDGHIAQLKIKTSPDATMVAQMVLVREFLKDQNELLVADLNAKWGQQFKAFYDAQLAVTMLCDATTELLKNQNPNLTTYLKKILGGSITQGGAPEHARDLYYELWLAALLSEAGFTVHLKEPDIVIEGNGLSQHIGIACKYPSSEAKLHENISKGYSQLAAHKLKGFVAIGFDQLLMDITELDKKKYIDFRESERHPQELLQSVVNQASTALVVQRTKLYPSEDPINEILLTVLLGGIYGKPATFTFIGAFSFNTTEKCDISAEIRRIVECLHSTPAFETVTPANRESNSGVHDQ